MIDFVAEETIEINGRLSQQENTNNFPFVKSLLLNKTAFITGGGTGLGKAIASRFLSLGATVIITGRRKNILEETVDELSKISESISAIQCDVKDIYQVENAINETCEKAGNIDILVNNAAANIISPTEFISHNAFKVISDTVFMGTVHCTLTLGKKWITSKQKGVVLNIVTGYAHSGSSFVVPSACAKAGVLTLVKSLAVEWAKYGIRFVAISPGQFNTPGAFDRILPEQRMREEGLRKIPVGRYGDPKELADCAAFLVSDAAQYIVGETVHIDGGFGLNLAGEFNVLDSYSIDEWKSIARAARKTRS